MIHVPTAHALSPQLFQRVYPEMHGEEELKTLPCGNGDLWKRAQELGAAAKASGKLKGLFSQPSQGTRAGPGPQGPLQSLQGSAFAWAGREDLQSLGSQIPSAKGCFHPQSTERQLRGT